MVSEEQCHTEWREVSMKNGGEVVIFHKTWVLWGELKQKWLDLRDEKESTIEKAFISPRPKLPFQPISHYLSSGKTSFLSSQTRSFHIYDLIHTFPFTWGSSLLYFLYLLQISHPWNLDLGIITTMDLSITFLARINFLSPFCFSNTP